MVDGKEEGRKWAKRQVFIDKRGIIVAALATSSEVSDDIIVAAPATSSEVSDDIIVAAPATSSEVKQ